MEKNTNHERAVSLMEEIVSGRHGSAVTSEYAFYETETEVFRAV